MCAQKKSSQDYFIPDFSDGKSGAGGKKLKNHPRSTRIVWIITAALMVVLAIVLYSLNDMDDRQVAPTGSRAPAVEGVLPATGPYSDSQAIRDVLYRNLNIQEAPAVSADKDAAINNRPSAAVPAEQERPKTPPKVKVVHNPPSPALIQARQLSVTALTAAPSISLPGARGAGDSGEGAGADGGENAENAISRRDIAASVAESLGLSQRETAEDMNATSIAHQNRNKAFVKSLTDASPASDYLPHTRQAPVSKYELKAGSLISGVMMSGINSDLPGTIIGQTSEHIYDTPTGSHILIPQGSRIIGTYDSQVVYGQNRILVVWQRIIYPDGSSLNIGGMLGSDAAGYAGFKQKVDNHYGRMLGAAIFASVFVAAGKEATKNDNTNSNSSNGNNNQSGKSIFAEAVMENVTNIATKAIEKNLNIAPTLRILPGYRFTIVTTKDVAFAAPYVVHRGGNR